MKKINFSFFMLLILIMQVIFTDIIIYCTGMRYAIANVIGLAINIVLIILFIKKKWIQIKSDFSKWDLIFLVIILVTTIATIIFPDEFWDSYSYHIYLQENPFADKINDDFFPGRTLTSFVFPIADRIFCMFRSALGFRLGTLPGYLIIIVMFYQIKKILKNLLNTNIEEKYISILSILPIGAFIILQQMGTYYIDNFSIIILLEFIYIVLYESDEIFKNKIRLYFLAFIAGIGVCIKITNAIYMIGPLVYLLIKNIKDIKQIKWYDYILLIITAFLPMAVYFIDAVIQTGSPVFPYYNSILKSEYFSETNWLDTRYGPKTIFEFLMWPIYIMKYPQRAYEVGKTDIAFAAGYIIIIAYFIKLLYNRLIKKEKIQLDGMLIYVINLLYLYIVWEKFIIGYTRYAGIIVVLSSILIIKLFLNAIQEKKIIMILILAGILTLGALQSAEQYIQYGSPIKYVQAYKKDIGAINTIKQNIGCLFKDKRKYKYDIDGIWGVIYDDSAVPMLLNTDDRLVHLEYGFKTGQSEKTDEIYWDNVLNNDIYVPLYSFKTEGKLEYFDIFHFEIEEIVDVIEYVNFLQGNQTIYIVKVKYNENISSGNKEIFEKLQQEYLEEKIGE